MPSPLPLPQRTTRRNVQNRRPLQERSRSQANEMSARLVRDTRNDPGHMSMSSTPYPTKPAQVLLPSTLRRTRVRMDEENIITRMSSCSELGDGGSNVSLGSPRADDADRPRTAHSPTLTLKRSVAALRDMYEAQAEKARPSTATSPVLRPSTSNSRLRSMSSTESLSRPHAWKSLNQMISAEDLALLPSRFPSLRDFSGTVSTVTSDFESRSTQQSQSSSPNIVKIGSTSSPEIPPYNDLSQFNSPPANSSSGSGRTYGTSPGPTSTDATSSSPNVVLLGRSSSFHERPEGPSSPNLIRLGSSSSVGNGEESLSSSFLSLDSSPNAIKQHMRKRSLDPELLSYAERSGVVDPFTSSPPYKVPGISRSIQDMSSPEDSTALPSSPPRRRVDQTSRPASEFTSDAHDDHVDSLTSSSSAVGETHADLQAALSSSPGPPIQYPIVRAPASPSWIGLSIPKRPPRAAAADPVRWTSRLSTVPSERSARNSRSHSRQPSSGDQCSLSDTDSDLTSKHAYMADNGEAVHSREWMVPSSEAEQNEEEATDSVAALPAQCRSPQLSFLGTNSNSNSSNSRLNSLRNSMDARLNSMKSFTNSFSGSRHDSLRNSQRPTSSSSTVSSFQVPVWARKYYSGIYRDSFQYMYASAVDISNPYATNIPVGIPPLPRKPSTSNISIGRPSTATSRRSPIIENIQSIFRPRSRPRLEARQSHLEPGVGPLVSNPVRPATPDPDPVLVPLPATDPRAHWVGAEEYTTQHQRCQSCCLPQKNRIYSGQQRQMTSWSRSPHLHRGDRSKYDHGRWKAPSLDEKSEPWLSWRNGQIICFLLGFVTVIPWFVGAFLPLPERPQEADLEKRHSADMKAKLRRQMAVVDELRWENTRWWRGLNRWMCCVGFVVLTLVVVLSVIGTRNW